jgi:peptide-methionine (S)-S-oxide reductase
MWEDVRMSSMFSNVAALCFVCSSLSMGSEAMSTNRTDSLPKPASAPALAMFGAGCFWCSEAVFQRTPGVIAVQSGYAGGRVKHPSYEQVCTGDTGHAEVVKVTYDPGRVSYEQLLEVFWSMHDPTTLNRQGADVGTQYRSVIFAFTPEQQAAAVKSKQALNRSGRYGDPVVTEIVPESDFFPAEAKHADYFDRNRAAPYCRFVIAPKLKKLGLEQ